MEYRKIKMSKLSDAEIKKYGEIVDVENINPNYKCDSFSFWENLSVIKHEFCSMCMVQSYLREKNKNTIFENHNDTTETIVPLNGDIVLLLGKSLEKDKEKLNLNSIIAFKLESGKAFILGKNIWHYAPISINKDVKILILFEKDTPNKDTILYLTDEMDGIVFEVEI